MNIHIKKEFKFEASHQLPNHDGKCARLHGHSWVLEVWVMGQLITEGPKEGMVMDYADLKAAVEPIVKRLDHFHLGFGNVGDEVEGDHFLYPAEHLMELDFPKIPTSENILVWIAGQLPTTLNWQCLCLHETCTSEARLYAVDYAQEVNRG